jgi:hypothetical protein
MLNSRQNSGIERVNTGVMWKVPGSNLGQNETILDNFASFEKIKIALCDNLAVCASMS